MKSTGRDFFARKLRHHSLVFFSCVLFLFLPMSLAAESLQAKLVAGDYRLVAANTKEFRIEMTDKGFSRLYSPGDPALPVKIVELKVPDDGSLSNIKITVDGADVKDLSQAYDIVPEGPSMLDRREHWGEGKSIVRGRNAYVYGKNAFFPGNAIELLPTVTKKELASQDGKKRTYRLVRYIRLAFRPFAYNPVARQLKVTQAASVTVTYDVAASGMAPMPLSAPTGTSVDYVIITTNQIVSKSGMLQSFVKMKQAAGRTVRIVTENDYDSLTGQAPNGRSEKIRQWLINNYLSLGIDYVLLIGDPHPADPLNPSAPVGDVPMKMCYPQIAEPGDREYPTDFFYADLVGNWDLDGDGLYGEMLPVNHATSPAPTVGPDNFSARWTGKIQFDYSEDYWIGAFSDDGVRIYLDGNPVPVVDNWTDHTTATEYDSDFMTMTAGLHDITVEYYQKTGDAVIKLYWDNVTRVSGKAVVPADHLYHYDAAVSDYVAGGLDASYYNSTDLSGTPALTDVEIINNVWMAGDDGPGGRQTNAQVSVGRIPVYDNDYYALDQILAKLSAYETDPGDLTWRETILLPMVPLDPTTPAWSLGEAVKGNVTDPLGFKSFRIYAQDFAPSGPTPELWPCTDKNVVNEWLNHYGMVTWWTHGGYDSANNVLATSECVKLDDGYPSFVFQGSCSNGYPEFHDNLGYSLLKDGAIATVSGTRVTMYSFGNAIGDIHSDANQNMAYFYTSYVMNNGGSPMAAGDALKAVNAQLPYVGLNTMAFTLYGDPDGRLLSTTPHVRPVAALTGPYSCIEGQSVVLDASGSYESGGGALQYQWDTNGDGKWDTDWSSSPTHTLEHCNQFTIVSVQVRDNVGVTAWTSASVVVSNIAPTVEAGPNQTAIVNTAVDFSGVITDPGDDIYSYVWDFGDGSSTVNWTLTPSHTYTSTGTFTVTLKAKDKIGDTGSDSLQVKVTAVPPPSPLSNENPARPWTKVQGNFTLSNDTSLKSEGTLSLKFNGTGYMVVATPVFASSEITSYSSQLSLDIYMSSPATNPSWLGQVQLFVTCPSGGIYNQPAGQVDLTGLALDKWDTLNFALPAKIVNLFKGSYKDVQINVAVNTNQTASKPYRIDNFRFTGKLIAK